VTKGTSLQTNLVSVVPASINDPENWKWLFLAGAVAAILYLQKRHRSRQSGSDGSSKESVRALSRQELTERFTSSIPELTRELNLELATAEFIETFDRNESKSVLWGLLPLGTNTGSIVVPVTYRYHLRLLERWQLEVKGAILIVRAPEIRASVPPAFNSAEMRTRSSRGWLRLPPDDLLAQLHRDLTPTMTGLASDPRRINLVRETCRQSVAEFVLRWLDGEKSRLPAVQHVHVQFPDENPIVDGPPARLMK
jgi:hypothetical protein